MGQPMMGEPERREPGITCRAHLSDHLGHALGDVEALRELRVDEQTNLHKSLVPFAFRSLFRHSKSGLTAEFGNLFTNQQPLKAGVLIRSWRSPTWEMIR